MPQPTNPSRDLLFGLLALQTGMIDQRALFTAFAAWTRDKARSLADHQADPGRRSLELRKLLRRVTDVCNAIDYAHSRGVIHRDLKPANIIVGKHGETLVVDWGLAKAVGRADPSAGEQTLAPSSGGSSETLPGCALGTPAYMSPEQARGELNRLGPRSDVYSLGATLYCLLTGKPPFENEDIGVILRAVQDGHFQRPSRLDPLLDKALEAICLKAMATRPEDRYAAPKALADDLDRWMADEPVTAWREPLARRARRWAKRNRTAVTAAAVALVAGVVGLAAVLAVQTRAKADLARSRTAVQARYDLAVEAIKTFHTGVSEDFLLKQEQFKDVRDRLLESASDFYGKLGALLGKETDLASRRSVWQANYEVAELTRKVGKPEDALAAHRQVLSAREALAAEIPADPEIKADVGRSLTAVADLLLFTSQAKEAEATYRKAETLLVELGPTTAAARATLANCRSRLGALLYSMGRDDEALSVYRLARAEQEALAVAPGATAESRQDLAATIHGVAYLLAGTGKSSEAEAEFRKEQALFRSWPTTTPRSPNTATIWPAPTPISPTWSTRSADWPRPTTATNGRSRSANPWFRRTPRARVTAAAWHPASGAAAWPAARRATRPVPRPTPIGRWRFTTACRRGTARNGSRPPAVMPRWRAWPDATARASRPSPPPRRRRPWPCWPRRSRWATSTPMRTGPNQPSTRSATGPTSCS
ncbi:MAG: protein kinase [Isosphaerales bacterium]